MNPPTFYGPSGAPTNVSRFQCRQDCISSGNLRSETMCQQGIGGTTNKVLQMYHLLDAPQNLDCTFKNNAITRNCIEGCNKLPKYESKNKEPFVMKPSDFRSPAPSAPSNIDKMIASPPPNMVFSEKLLKRLK